VSREYKSFILFASMRLIANRKIYRSYALIKSMNSGYNVIGAVNLSIRPTEVVQDALV